MLTRLSIDFEHPSKAWWDAGGRELWEGVAGQADAPSVLVEESIARSWLAQAARIPGWDAGREFAPHPVRWEAVSDEDAEL
jgi:hypothetical protein